MTQKFNMEKDEANVGHELAALIRAGQAVEGPKDGCAVPYFPVD